MKYKEMPKRQSKSKIIAAILIIAIIAGTGIALLSLQPKPQPKDYGTIEEKIARQIEEAKAKSARPDYLPPVVYKNLPAFPEDFYVIDALFYIGKITDYVNLEEKYWKQPEFYPTFEANLDKIQNPSLDRFYAFGYGAYPGDIGVGVKPGDEFTVATFFYSSWLVETWQGMKMQHFYPVQTGVPKSDLNGTQFTVIQDPDAVKDYFDISFEPVVFLLGPSSTIFDYNWTQKILVHVKVSPDTPEGRYVIGVNPVAPPREYSNQWTMQYRLKYADASAGVVGRPFFQIVVDVS